MGHGCTQCPSRNSPGNGTTPSERQHPWTASRRGKEEAKQADETEKEQPKVDENLAKEGAGDGDGGELGAEAIRQQVAAAVEDGLAAIGAAP